ncbi:MAG: LytR C-terminal domain-containing protein [Gemmatimonadales bacterium]
MTDRIHTGVVVAVLLLVGALLGSVLLEWGNRRGGGVASDAPARSADVTTSVGERRVSLEVLNGAGDKGAAERVSDRLRDLGFDVKTFGNARGGFDHEKTVLLDRSRRPGAANAISAALGGVPVQVEPAPELYLDATLILGHDWREVLARDPVEPPSD